MRTWILVLCEENAQGKDLGDVIELHVDFKMDPQASDAEVITTLFDAFMAIKFSGGKSENVQ